MQGICFKEPLFHLTIKGIKKQTRRIMKPQPDKVRSIAKDISDYPGYELSEKPWTPSPAHHFLLNKGEYINPRYKVGEILYLKEPYYIETDYCIHDELPGSPKEEWEVDRLYKFDNPEKIVPFWENKLFMPEKYARHFIKITAVRAERLKDISNGDCIIEGIYKHISHAKVYWMNGVDGLMYDSPRYAYASLIDLINGKGTWRSNPFVWVYDYALITE